MQYCSLYKYSKKPKGAARNVALMISPAVSQSSMNLTLQVELEHLPIIDINLHQADWSIISLLVLEA